MVESKYGKYFNSIPKIETNLSGHNEDFKIAGTIFGRVYFSDALRGTVRPIIAGEYST
jgi:hypothetical protein